MLGKRDSKEAGYNINYWNMLPGGKEITESPG
jgi:hypothetical protein